MMKRSVLECDYCFNKTIIGHSEDEIILFCPHCGEQQDEALEELDFNE